MDAGIPKYAISMEHVMSVPDYQSFMLPLLKFAEDRREHPIDEAYQKLAEQMRLSEDDLNECCLAAGRPFFTTGLVGQRRI